MLCLLHASLGGNVSEQKATYLEAKSKQELGVEGRPGKQVDKAQRGCSKTI